MSEVYEDTSREGRERQRYTEEGGRLIAGSIPFRNSGNRIEVLT